MKLDHVQQVAVFYAPTPERRIKVGRLALKQRQILFEYDPGFVASGLELSPFKLPLAGGVVVGPPAPFGGLLGVFEDSLPDGWGRLLVDRRAAELGLSALALTPLDRLSVVGSRGMGALIYEPEAPLQAPLIVKLSELAKEVAAVLRDAAGPDLERLIALGGSPQGARPKVLIQIAPRGELHVGDSRLDPGFTSWLVKFPAQRDPPHVGPLEHAYFLMAEAAGLEVPRTRLLGRTSRTPGFFAIERFDRRGAERVHAHTVGGLLHLPLGYAALDYRDLLTLTRTLTRDEASVREMFRRACFNVLAHNREDHSRNFAFLMDEAGRWRPSPAYDLTFAKGPGGEHTTLVAGEGRAPERRHLLELAKATDVKQAKRILDQTRAAVSRFKQFADQAGVPAKLRNTVGAELAAHALA